MGTEEFAFKSQDLVSFKSTSVWWELTALDLASLLLCRFKSTSVWWELDWGTYKLFSKISFKSTSVWWEPALSLTRFMHIKPFQIHFGLMGTLQSETSIDLMTSFQIHFGLMGTLSITGGKRIFVDSNFVNIFYNNSWLESTIMYAGRTQGPNWSGVILSIPGDANVVKRCFRNKLSKNIIGPTFRVAQFFLG